MTALTVLSAFPARARAAPRIFGWRAHGLYQLARGCRAPRRIPAPRATRTVRGAISFNSPIHLPPTAGSLVVKPAMLPPGCARLTPKPLPIGSDTRVYGSPSVISGVDKG
jgi:hypothetical protein